MKTLMLTLSLVGASAIAQADTQYYYQTIPGTPLPSASRPAIAVEHVGGTTRVYQTRPGTTMQDLSAPSYTTYDRPDLSDLDMSKQIERLGRGEE